MHKSLIPRYHDTCVYFRLPNFQEKRPMHCENPSLECHNPYRRTSILAEPVLC